MILINIYPASLTAEMQILFKQTQRAKIFLQARATVPGFSKTWHLKSGKWPFLSRKKRPRLEWDHWAFTQETRFCFCLLWWPHRHMHLHIHTHTHLTDTNARTHTSLTQMHTHTPHWHKCTYTLTHKQRLFKKVRINQTFFPLFTHSLEQWCAKTFI